MACLLTAGLSGCGASAGGPTNTGSTGNTGNGGGVATLGVSASAVSFGTVPVGQTASASVSVTNGGTVPLQISGVSVTGQYFSAAQVSLPVTVAAGGSYSVTLHFNPATPGADTGTLTVSSNASSGGTATISLSGTGQASSGMGQATAGVLGGLSCSSGSMTRTDACTVTLTAAAGTGGLAVSLSSSSSAVTVPGSVTVPAGATTAGFSATVSSVTTAQTATLTATAGGVKKTCAIDLGATVPGLTLSTSSLSFGDVTVNSSATPRPVTLTSSGTAPLTISAGAVTGTGFSMSGVSFPLTLNPGQTATLNIEFDPTAAGAVTGSVTLTTNTTAATAAIALSGTGQATAGQLGGLSCSSGSMTRTGTDACTVTLTAAAGTGGLAVSLSSSSSAVTVPGSVTVPAGATTAGFSATVSSVTTAQTATLTATAGEVKKTCAIELGAAVPGLTLNSTRVAFGDVGLKTPATQSVTLTSSGTAPLIISAGAVTGTGFSMSGVSFPLTLNPGQTATLNIEFDPTAAGAVTGTVSLTTNTTAGTAAIALSGTGQAAAYQVDLSWEAPANPTVPVTGYKIYREVSGGSSYELLNTTVDSLTAYSDTTVADGTAYTYYVTSVDASGTQSAPSNAYTVTIP